jgi:hypothetical protein
MGVTVSTGTQASATGTRTAVYYTRTTMAEQLMGELPSSCRESGGTVPTRLSRIILGRMGALETRRDWRWRKANGTVSLVANDASFRMNNSYADFGKLLNQHLIETSDHGAIRITQNVDEFRAHQRLWNGQTGEPELGMFEPDTALSEHGVLLRLSPTSNGTYAYTFDYIKLVATYGATDVPKWPTWMFELWYGDCLWRALLAFDRAGGDWKDAKVLFEAELKQAELNDEPEQTQLMRISDGYGDAAAFSSSGRLLDGSYDLR